jgi:hypothetical protein
MASKVATKPKNGIGHSGLVGQHISRKLRRGEVVEHGCSKVQRCLGDQLGGGQNKY